ncbi:hypothetical protein DFH06DRAFT_726542 [Mycena polygramma]|nr:hypothetical protein DFH06DRAFT_726542 [Mycena polygramma]
MVLQLRTTPPIRTRGPQTSMLTHHPSNLRRLISRMPLFLALHLHTTPTMRTRRSHTSVLTVCSRSQTRRCSTSTCLPPITTHVRGISSASFLAPAVYPPQRDIALTTPHLPWLIPVAAADRCCVTVWDVLSAIYRSLRTNVTAAEFRALGSETLMNQVTEAYIGRYSCLRDRHDQDDEKAHGVKRVDFLVGCTRLRGITPTRAAGVWRLHIA